MCELHKMLMRPLDSDTDVYSVYESHEVDDYIKKLQSQIPRSLTTAPHTPNCLKYSVARTSPRRRLSQNFPSRPPNDTATDMPTTPTCSAPTPTYTT